MSNATTNYGLEKPSGSEYYDVEIQNRNMDKIDGKFKEHDTYLNERTKSLKATAWFSD